MVFNWLTLLKAVSRLVCRHCAVAFLVFYYWICWLMIISKWHSMEIHRVFFFVHRKLSIQLFKLNRKREIIHWYQSDDVIVCNSDKSVIINVVIMYPVDIEHDRNPFDDILILFPFRSSRIKSKYSKIREEIILNIIFIFKFGQWHV